MWTQWIWKERVYFRGNDPWLSKVLGRWAPCNCPWLFIGYTGWVGANTLHRSNCSALADNCRPLATILLALADNFVNHNCWHLPTVRRKSIAKKKKILPKSLPLGMLHKRRHLILPPHLSFWKWWQDDVGKLSVLCYQCVMSPQPHPSLRGAKRVQRANPRPSLKVTKWVVHSGVWTRDLLHPKQESYH